MIKIWFLTTDTKQVTLAVAVKASGQVLPPMLIFKWAQNSHIVNCDGVMFPKGGQYVCQKNV